MRVRGRLPHQHIDVENIRRRRAKLRKTKSKEKHGESFLSEWYAFDDESVAPWSSASKEISGDRRRSSSSSWLLACLIVFSSLFMVLPCRYRPIYPSLYSWCLVIYIDYAVVSLGSSSSFFLFPRQLFRWETDKDELCRRAEREKERRKSTWRRIESDGPGLLLFRGLLYHHQNKAVI